MRFLHTADWHVGRAIRGRSRAAEFEAVLAEVVEIARAEHVEAMLVAGDIWDTPSPPPDAERLVYETLRACIGHGIQVVLLAGNHDSPRRLEALGLLSDLLGVQTQPYVRRPDAGGVLTVEGTEHTARIAAVPFVNEGTYVGAAQLLGLEADWWGNYADGLPAVLAGMCAGLKPDTVNLLMGHLFIDGARIAGADGSERLLHIGQTYGINPQRLPSTPQYIALGHVHEPQEVLSVAVPTAYSGSLLQLDFGERGQQKMVRIIDAVPGRPARSEAIPLTKGRRLTELRGTLDDVLAQVERARDDHLRVVLDVERPEPGLAQRVRDVAPSVVDVRLEYAQETAYETVSLAGLAPEELFVRYYRTQRGVEPAPELLSLFRELQEAAVAEEVSA